MIMKKTIMMMVVLLLFGLAIDRTVAMRPERWNSPIAAKDIKPLNSKDLVGQKGRKDVIHLHRHRSLLVKAANAVYNTYDDSIYVFVLRILTIYWGIGSLVPNAMISDSGTQEAETAAKHGMFASFLWVVAGILPTRAVAPAFLLAWIPQLLAFWHWGSVKTPLLLVSTVALSACAVVLLGQPWKWSHRQCLISQAM